MKFSKDDRVYTRMVNDKTGEVRDRWGTVVHDEIEGWDYIDVYFDDFPAFPILVVAWYLFKEGESDASL